MVPMALPMRLTNSSPNSSAALPRMSYARNMWCGNPSSPRCGRVSALALSPRFRSRSRPAPSSLSSSSMLPDWNMGLVRSLPWRGRISTLASGMSVVGPTLPWRKVRSVARRNCLATETSPGMLSSSGDFISAAEISLLIWLSRVRLNMDTTNPSAPIAANRQSPRTASNGVELMASSLSRPREGVNSN